MLDVNEPALEADTGEGGRDFESFYRDNRRRVVALAYGLTGSASAAEELAQEAFLAAFRRWDRIARYDDPGAWVRRVVVNRSVSRVRRAVAEARAMARLRSRPMRAIELEAHDDEFWRAVRALPARQAQVIVMHYVDDSTVDDIAAVLGIAPGTVKATLFQARRTLLTSLGCDPEDDE